MISLFIVVAACNRLSKIMISIFKRPCHKSLAHYPHFYVTHPFDQRCAELLKGGQSRWLRRPKWPQEDVSEAIYELYGFNLLCEPSFKVSLLVKKWLCQLYPHFCVTFKKRPKDGPLTSCLLLKVKIKSVATTIYTPASQAHQPNA